jgi:hypothetical protein
MHKLFSIVFFTLGILCTVAAIGGIVATELPAALGLVGFAVFFVLIGIISDQGHQIETLKTEATLTRLRIRVIV